MFAIQMDMIEMMVAMVVLSVYNDGADAHQDVVL